MPKLKKSIKLKKNQIQVHHNPSCCVNCLFVSIFCIFKGFLYPLVIVGVGLDLHELLPIGLLVWSPSQLVLPGPPLQRSPKSSSDSEHPGCPVDSVHSQTQTVDMREQMVKLINSQQKRQNFVLLFLVKTFDPTCLILACNSVI